MVTVYHILKPDGSVGWGATYADETEGDAWVRQEEANNSWGQPGTYKVVKQYAPENLIERIKHGYVGLKPK